VSSSCPIALIIRRQTATPALSPSAPSSSARLLLSASAVSPYHHRIREAARQMPGAAPFPALIRNSLPARWLPLRDARARLRCAGQSAHSRLLGSLRAFVLC